MSEIPRTENTNTFQQCVSFSFSMCETRQTVDNDSIPHVLIHPQLELQLQSIFNE